jgi:hypothetical protein
VEGIQDSEVDILRAEITGLLAAALKSDTDHADEIKQLEDVQADEIAELLAAASKADTDHADEIRHLEERHAAVVANLNLALGSRDLIGQAKGVLMVTLGRSADEAFALMVKQSQHENRKITAIAAEVVERTQRQRRDGSEVT